MVAASLPIFALLIKLTVERVENLELPAVG
jgi:hypothetical protein